jgi:hypothetical protein
MTLDGKDIEFSCEKREEFYIIGVKPNTTGDLEVALIF